MRMTLLSWVIWYFPKIRDTLLGVPIIRLIVFWGLYWGPPIQGNYHIGTTRIYPLILADQKEVAFPGIGAGCGEGSVGGLQC